MKAKSLGARFAQALADKDRARIIDLLDPAVDFRGVTPQRFWEASDPQALVADVLWQWFEDSDEIEALEKVETDAFADRERVGYRFRVRNPEGRFLVEQQLYIAAEAGRISWMRAVCSGFRPLG
ncbi:MAG: hypothetical protein ACM3NV_03500 [Syntrophothermus sp.]